MLISLLLGALATSFISGVIGMGGGVLLLSIMTFFLPFQLIVPIHGVVQLISNTSRSWYLRKNILWDFFVPFLFGTPFGLIVSYFLLKNIKGPTWYYLLLGIFITYVIFKPKKFPEIRLRKKGWFLLGIAAAIQGPILGVTGPLLAPFFSRSDIQKENIVATKAVQQIVTHFFKIPLFLSLDFNFLLHSELMALMSLGAIIGTLLGVRFLAKINEAHFKMLFKSVLALAALRLYYKFASSILGV